MAEGSEPTPLGELQWEARLKLQALADDIAEADRRLNALYERQDGRTISVRVAPPDAPNAGPAAGGGGTPGGPDAVRQVADEALAATRQQVQRPVDLSVNTAAVDAARTALVGLDAAVADARRQLGTLGDDAAQVSSAVASSPVGSSAPSASTVEHRLAGGDASAQAAVAAGQAAEAAGAAATAARRVVTAPANPTADLTGLPSVPRDPVDRYVLSARAKGSAGPSPASRTTPFSPLADLSRLPDYVREPVQQRYALAERAGVVPEIERLSYADRLTVGQVRDRLGPALPSTPNDTQADVVRAVRTRLGIPSQDERTDFEGARSTYLSRVANPPPPGASPVAGPLPTDDLARLGQAARAAADDLSRTGEVARTPAGQQQAVAVTQAAAAASDAASAAQQAGRQASGGRSARLDPADVAGVFGEQFEASGSEYQAGPSPRLGYGRATVDAGMGGGGPRRPQLGYTQRGAGDEVIDAEFEPTPTSLAGGGGGPAGGGPGRPATQDYGFPRGFNQQGSGQVYPPNVGGPQTVTTGAADEGFPDFEQVGNGQVYPPNIPPPPGLFGQLRGLFSKGIPPGFGRALSAYGAIRGGIDTAEAAGDAFAAAGAYDPAEQARDVAAGQSAIGRIPLVGPIISGLGSGIYRFGSAYGNFQASRGFESDASYGERVQRETAPVNEAALVEQQVFRGQVATDREQAGRDVVTGITSGYGRQVAQLDAARDERLATSRQEQDRETTAARATEAAQTNAALSSARSGTFNTIERAVATLDSYNPLSRNLGQAGLREAEDRAQSQAQDAIHTAQEASNAAERSARTARARRDAAAQAADNAAREQLNNEQSDQRQGTIGQTEVSAFIASGGSSNDAARLGIVNRQAIELAAARRNLPTDPATGRTIDPSAFTAGVDPVTGVAYQNAFDPVTGQLNQDAANLEILPARQAAELAAFDAQQRRAQAQRAINATASVTVTRDTAGGNVLGAGQARIDATLRSALADPNATGQDVQAALDIRRAQTDALAQTIQRTQAQADATVASTSLRNEGFSYASGLASLRGRLQVTTEGPGGSNANFADLDPSTAANAAERDAIQRTIETRRAQYQADRTALARQELAQTIGADTSASIGQATLDRDPLAGQLASINGQFRSATATVGPDGKLTTIDVTSPEYRRAVAARDTQSALARQGLADRAGDVTLGQATQQAVMNAQLYVGPGGQRGDPLGAELAGIVGAGEQQARSLAQQGLLPQARTALDQTQQNIQLAQRAYYDQFSATSVGNPRTIDFGNPRVLADTRREMADFANAGRQIGQDQQRLAGGNIPGGGTVKLDNQSRDVIEGAIRAALDGVLQH